MDIEMCIREDCPVKHKCLRYTAKPSENQKYVKIYDRCDMFLKDFRAK